MTVPDSLHDKLPSANTSRLVELVVESFSTDDWGELCRRGRLEIEELAALRNAFVMAGAARLHELANPRPWIQANLTLDLGRQWPACIQSDLQDQVRGWLKDGIAERFFFMHKPPGVRFRVRGRREDLVPALSAQFDNMKVEGLLDAWKLAPYDAETYQFGGEAGLELAHDFFTFESLAVLAYHRLCLRSPALVALSPATFSLLILDDLLREVVEDEWELWDVWRKMSLTGRATDRSSWQEDSLPDLQVAPQAFVAALKDPTQVPAMASEPERAVLTAYRSQLPRIGANIRRAVTFGHLLWGLREILPFWIIFHWNRMGFDLSRQRSLTMLMIQALDPKQEW